MQVRIIFKKQKNNIIVKDSEIIKFNNRLERIKFERGKD